MIEVRNLCHYVPHGREAVKLKPRVSNVEQRDGILSTHYNVEKSSNIKVRLCLLCIVCLALNSTTFHLYEIMDYSNQTPHHRARNNVPNVPDHGDRQSRLFADQIKIWLIRSICPHFLEKVLNMPVNTHLNRKFNFVSNSSLNN